MNTYQSFNFEDYGFDALSKTLTFHYSLDSTLFFQEIYSFNFDFVDYNEQILDKAIQHLFFIAGVSYYKTYVPKNIVVNAGSINKNEADFYAKTYEKGLGEFWYVNNLDPKTKINFPVTDTTNIYDQTIPEDRSGFLVAIGGGKDSLVSLELLRANTAGEIATWSLNHEEPLKPLIERMSSTHYYVNRIWDSKLTQPGIMSGSYNGHVPISAIFACVGVIIAILTGKKDVVMSNERSADEATLLYRGTEINHQYSKSSEFEKDFQALLQNSFKEGVRYYSLLRPLSEIQIAKLFAGPLFDTYQDVFSSCNRAYVHGSKKLFWDGLCSKCAFVYLILRLYVEDSKLDILFGENLLLKPELDGTYKQLLGIASDKPLECVGEIAESRWAMDQMKQVHMELARYNYQPVPESKIFYLGTSNMPNEIESLVTPILQQRLGQQ